MNKGLLTSLLCIFFFANFLNAQNPHGDLRIEMLEYFNLVVDHNIQTPAGASPEAVYIGVQICNDGGNDMTDVFAYIGDYNAGTPGLYPTYTAPSNRPYSGTFSFTHEGGQSDATRFIGDLAAGECITQYWLLSYPLMDANGVPVFGSNSKTWDDMPLEYDVWATAMDNGNLRIAEDSKTVKLRAQLSANANKIWPNNTNQVASGYVNAFPEKELGWHMTSNVTHPGATVALEGNWFRLGRVNKGFDNDGDYQRDYNFMIQPVGNPDLFDPNCFRLVKVSGLIVVKRKSGGVLEIPFEDQLHFKNLPTNNTDGSGFVVYEFAVLNGPCSASLTPYQEAASGKNREKFNADFGNTGDALTSDAPTIDLEVSTPLTISPGDQFEAEILVENTASVPLGQPEYGAEFVIEQQMPSGTFYVGGSATNNNTLPAGTGVEILYSTDDGQTWTSTEPTPASSVSIVQWWLDRPFQPGEEARVTLELSTPPDYSESVVTVEPGVAIGNADPFMNVTGTVAVQGGLTISGVVFFDNGDGFATVGDGVQTGGEAGVPNITVKLWNDVNGNGEMNSSDFLVQQVQTDPNGNYSFPGLSNGNYLVEVDQTDGDLPQGMTNTSPLLVSLAGVSSDVQSAFGFAPLLEVTNTLISDAQAFESAQVQYQVQLENLAYAEDTDNSSTVTAWATQLDPATNFDYYKNNLLGPPDQYLSWPSNWKNKKAKVKGFQFGPQNGQIEKVEIILSICLDYAVYNDYLVVSFVDENGNTQVVPDPVLGKWSTPSLNDYVGPPNIGLIILDVTDRQNWDWDVFDSNWSVSVDGIRVNGDDGAKQYTDAIGVRVTSTCCASSGGEPGNPCATITKTPMTYEYDQTQLQFVSASVVPDNISNGVISYEDIGPLYSNQISTIEFNFEALQPNGSPVTTTVTIADGETGCGIGVTDTDESEPLTIVNLGSLSGVIFGDADNDGWRGVTGYEVGTDNFIPNVEVNLYACLDDSDELIYPAPNRYYSCTNWRNDGHWELVKSDTTDANGAYRMGGLNNGYYYLEVDEVTLTNSAEQTADPDYTYGIPSPSWKLDKRWKRPDWQLRYTGEIGIGNDQANVNFGYHVQSSISGIVYQDANGNGVKDPEENTIPNVTVELASNGCSNCPTVNTNGQGHYTFNQVSPGINYSLSIDLNSVQGADNWAVTGNPAGLPVNNFDLSLTSAGQQVFDQNFGVQSVGDLTLAGKVYYDWSGNAHLNAGDEGMPGVEVRLYEDLNHNGTLQATDQFIQETLTDINGDYVFANKPEGDYIVKVMENSVPIFPKQTEDPDEYGVCTTCDGMTAVVEADYQASVADAWNLFNSSTGCTICDEGYTSTNDQEYIDNNLDIINFQDPIGSATACVTQVSITMQVAASDFQKDYYTSQVNQVDYDFPIELNGVQIGTFDPVEMPYWCGICEKVTLVFDVDLNAIGYNFGGQNTLDLNFSSFNLSKPYGQRADVCVADVDMEFIGSGCESSFLTLDFGYQPTGEGQVRGCVFEDENNNALVGNDEPSIDNVEIQLDVDFNEDDVFYTIASTTTDSGGEFRFEDLPDGNFRVVVNQLDPDLPQDANGAPVPLTTTADYRVQVEDGVVTKVDDQPASEECGSGRPTFGFGRPGMVIGIVYSDNNSNGQEDAGEEGIPGVTLYICDANDGYCDATNALDTVVTAAETPGLPGGYYFFTGRLPGDYTVAVDQATVPADYVLTGDPSTDGIPCVDNLLPSHPDYEFLLAECDYKMPDFALTYGSEYAGVDFGIRPRGVLGTTVWHDDNEDGVFDDNEEGMLDIEVSVRNNSTINREGVTYNPGEYTETTYTDSDGDYSFSKLSDGIWELTITPPADYVSTHDVDGLPDNTVIVEISNGGVSLTGNAWCPLGQECSLDLDFGLRPNYTNSLSGYVCLDDNDDGQCHSGNETFPEGSEVSIFHEDGTFFGQTQTDNTGAYAFSRLPNANMVVSVSKVDAPLRLTSLTTSIGDTPAYDVEDSEDNSIQKVLVNGDITGIDFAFSFTDTFDLGDLPNPYETRVTAASTGAAHRLSASPNLYLGNVVDSEEFPTLYEDASGDDVIGQNDDDGVTLSDPATWVIGDNGASVDVQVQGNGHLIGFIDFNEDGDFDDNGEMAVNEPVNSGAHTFSIRVPVGTALSGGQDFYSRFRLFPAVPVSPSTAYRGLATEGEVEDYLVSVCKNIDDPGTISGTEMGCNGFDPAAISADRAPAGGGGDLEFQWEYSEDNGLTWATILNETTASYDPGFLNQTTRFRRGVRRARCQDFVYSNVVEKTIVTNYDDPGAIVGQEDNCGIYDPEIITNVIAPNGGSGTSTPEYQWQFRTDASPAWVNISAATSEFFDPGVISVTTYYRRGARKSPCLAFTYSGEIKKMVSVNYISPGTIGGDESICGPFDPTEITSHALPMGGMDGYEQIQWEQSTNDGASWSNISGATSATFDPGVITQTTWFRRKARRVPCAIWVNSNVVKKTVKPYPSALIIDYPVSSGFLCELTEYDFEAADAASGTNFNWNFTGYGSPTSAEGKGPHHIEFDVPDGTVSTTGTISLTTELNGCVSTDSRALTFRPEIIVDSVTTVDPAACSVKDGIINVYATFPVGSNIQYSVDGGLTWSNNYQTTSLGAGVYDVRVRYQGNECDIRHGNVALSDPPPQADVFVSSSEECTNETIVVEAVATVGAPVFTWTFGNGAIPNTASGPGPHSVYFTQGGFANIAVTLDEAGCIGVRDTNIAIVKNIADGGTIIGGETLCSTFDPAEIRTGSNPAGGIGGALEYQWEYREDDGAGGWTAWQDVAGEVSTDFDPGIIAATTEFRRKARRTPCSDWEVSNSVVARLVTKPTLSDDNYNTVCPGFPHADNVNDNDIDLVNASYSLLTFPTNGTLDFEADGEFIYDPNSTFCGTDEFKYLVCNDGTGCCDTANVVVDLTDSQPPNIVNVPADLTISCDDQIPFADAVDVTENCQSVSLSLDEYTTQGTEGCEYYNYESVRIWNGVDYCSNAATAQQTMTIMDMTAPDIYRIYTLPNGKKMVAGVMENVSNHWKTVSLPIQFATQPVVLAQVASRNEANTVNARLRNVSTTQFQLTVQEEEAGDGAHTQENVAWVAFEKGAMAGSDAFEVNTWLMTDALANLTFAQAFATTPHVFMATQTTNENDPVNVRMNSLSATGMDAWLEEETSADPEVTHNLETVAYLAFANAGDLTTADGEVFGEIGTVNITDGVTSVPLNNKYHNAAVIISVIPNGEHEPVTARVLNIEADKFDVKLEEWDFLDGIHGAEVVSYLVIEGSLPLDRTVSCDNIPEPLTVGADIIAVDNCDATIQLVMTESDYAFDCKTDTVFTRTWKTVDDCGNLTELTQTFYLEDTEAPEFTVPENITIVCGADKDDLMLTGDVNDETDNCTDDVEAAYTDDMSGMNGCVGQIVRTWVAEDNCGNATQKIQFILVSPDGDNDRDGVVDLYDLDDDNDGIPDLTEGYDDFDQDGIPNYLDRDSDNDGIPDLIEIGGEDTDGDGVVDIVGELNWDHDIDGFAFGYDGNDGDTTVVGSVTFLNTSLVVDRDQDGIPNYLDRDSDNDGIADIVEAGGVDTNGDGMIDYPTLGVPSSLVDADHDGYTDTYDADDDGQSGPEDIKDPLVIFDGVEYKGGRPNYRPDFDADKVPDFLDSDSDNDGIADLIEAGGIDTDGDGRIEVNGSFVDNNNDGFKDIYSTYPLVAVQEDGVNADGRPSDTDGNGTTYTVGDTDMDGEPNHRDHDSDGDNIIDIFETGMFEHDGDGDGVLDTWNDTNLNGFDDVVEAAFNILTEDDGVTIDGRPEDSGDADETAYLGSVSDGDFATANGNPDIDDDADNIPNFLDSDSDDDLLPDTVEDRNADGRQSPGETGAYNPDSDDDEIRDGIEDMNRNGVFEITETDPLNPNTDGDPLLDGEEDVNFNGIVDVAESDPRNPCDPILNEACRGVILDLKISLLGAAIEADTSGLMRDDIRDEQILPNFEPYTSLVTVNHLGEDYFVEIPDSIWEEGYNPTIIGGAPGYGNAAVGTSTTYDPTNAANGITGFGMSNSNLGHREYCAPGTFYMTGNDAPVDWVLVELRSALVPDSVVATRAALLQRDGDIRDIDGYSYVTFGNIPSGNFYVAVRHRNHLGAMTATPLVLSPDPTRIDFTDDETSVYGDNSRVQYGDKMAMWPGDFNGDGKIIYQGPGNDVLKLFQEVILSEQNTETLANFILPGYGESDFNLDGKTIFQGPNNDKAKILFYSIISAPENGLGLANYILTQNLP